MSGQPETDNVKTWSWIVLMVIIILAAGMYAFVMVSDKGHPDWDFRPVRDVPGQSPHAGYELLPNPQHVKGKEGE